MSRHASRSSLGQYFDNPVVAGPDLYGALDVVSPRLGPNQVPPGTQYAERLSIIGDPYDAARLVPDLPEHVTQWQRPLSLDQSEPDDTCLML
jgi:hypothetical protein